MRHIWAERPAHLLLSFAASPHVGLLVSAPPVAPDSPTKPDGNSASNRQLIARMLGLAWRHRLGCILVLAQQTSLLAVSLLGLNLAGLGIDVVRAVLQPGNQPPRWPFGISPPDSRTPRGQLGAIAVGIVALALCHALLRFWAALTASRLVQQIVIELRCEVYDKLQHMSFRFFDAHETGSIINRVAGDVQAVRQFVDGVLIQFLVTVLSLAIYLLYMCRVHVPLTLACLATTPLLALSAAVFSRRTRPMYVYARELTDRLILRLSENVQGVQVVRGFALEAHEVARFRDANDRINRHKHKIFWFVSLFQPSMGLLTQLNMLVLLGYGSWLVVHGEILLGEGLFVFANLLHQFANQVGQITNITNSIQVSLTGAQRVFEVLDAPVEIRSNQEAPPLERAAGQLQFDRVSFCYQPGEPALEEIDLVVPAGACVALVGPTGSGKTTLLQLIPRFYDPTEGRVLLDGHDLRQLRLEDVRRNVGVVFQESFLFSNTVAANIAYGRPTATREQIERAARLAAAEEFINRLPQRYDSLVGEHGNNLSGGQRQRLALARALVLDPAILLLDDPLAAVDPETEHEILAALETAMQGRTTFIVAHRLSTLRRADLILVLENGRITQRGTHAELLNAAGHYREAARLQTASEDMSLALEQAAREG